MKMKLESMQKTLSNLQSERDELLKEVQDLRPYRLCCLAGHYGSLVMMMI